MVKSDSNSRFRVPYSKRFKVTTDVSGASRTKQSFKDECDINVIMRRYQKTGVIPFLDQREPRFMDCSAFDFQEAQNLVAGARSMFQELSAQLRERFDNDPGRLLEFLNDERNREEAVQLGLVRPPVPDAVPVKVEVTNPATGTVEAPEGIPKSVKK